MNIKTYGFVKYIATLGALFLFLAPLLGFLQQWSYLSPSHFHDNFVFRSDAALAATLWVLEIIGIILVMAYLYIRTRLKNKSGYVYTKKDNLKLALSFGFYGAEIIVSFIYVIISCGLFGYPTLNAAGTAIDPGMWGANNSHSRVVALMITFAPFYVAQFAFAILAAIFESMSRIQEQVYLYNQQEDEKQKNGKAVSKSGTRRTKEAQALLDDEDEKPSTKKSEKTKKETKHKAEEYIDDQKTLEDFFNEDDDEDDKKDNK